MSVIQQQYTEFPSIIKQAKAIGYLYKLFGLYSIILLTVVTIISMTNVFTSGEFAQWPFVQGLWAFIFSLAIDVNIVRLFVEARIERSKGAFVIGIGLGCVTGAALLIEGLQQSIGIQWDNQTVQSVIAGLIGLRVLLVVILMAREGYKLGKLIEVTVKPTVQAEAVQSVQSLNIVPVLPDVQEVNTSPEHAAITSEQTNIRPMRRSKVDTPEQKARHIWTENPNISVRALATQIGKSPTTANTMMKKFRSELEAISLDGIGGN